MMISLITATLGRVQEMEILLDSLAAQTYKNFELIIVDQNSHTLLEEMSEKYAKTMNIKYIRSDVKGLSYNRNIGLKHSVGDIVGFPDDDCFYDKRILENVVGSLSSNSYMFVAAEMKDPETNFIWLKRIDTFVFRKNIYKYCLSCNIFVRRNPLVFFDERMGTGARFGSGEESDYLWSVLKKKDVGAFLKDAYIYHSYNNSSFDIHRAYTYGLGFGALFKKEIFYRKNTEYVLIYVCYLLRILVGCVVKKNRIFYYYTLLGRIKGFYLFHIKS